MKKRPTKRRAAGRSGDGFAPPKLWKALLFFLLLAAPALVRVHYKTKSVMLGYRLEEMQQERYGLKDEAALLSVERATLERLERIERLSVAQGLEHPPVERRVYLPEGSESR